jgi:hypothetical protein
MAQTTMPAMSREMQECIDNCLDCHAVCERTIAHCLRLGGRHAAPDHIRLLQDCSQICATSADFMLRESDLHKLTCGVCAEVCERCAEHCERMAGDDEQMRECVRMCRECAATCRQMAA